MEIRVVKVEREWGPIYVIVKVLPQDEVGILGAFVITSTGYTFLDVDSLSMDTWAKAMKGARDS